MEKEINLVDKYVNNGTWRLQENANQIYCVGHMMNFLSASIIYDYWLNNVFSEKAKKFHKEGRIHIHDLSRSSAYCLGISTSDVLKKGLIGPKGRITSTPPKHLGSAINQLVNLVGVISQEVAGAVALNDFSLYLAPFVSYDKLDRKQVKQEIQEFIFHMNQPSRWAGEAPFSNITINLTVPDDMKDVKVIIGGEEKSRTYKEFETEMNIINDVILEVLIEGDANGTPMTFPVLTIGVDKNFPWESEIAKKIFQVTAKYGTPFFENFTSDSGRDPADSRSLCCRLSLSKKELRKHTGGIFGNADSMGSLGVCTINLNRIGYLAKNKTEYYKLIDENLEVCKDVLEKRREKVTYMFNKGMYPYLKNHIPNFKNFFNTIGVIGGNESMLNYMGKNLMDDEAIVFTEELLTYINEKCKVFQQETGNLFNLEGIPGEGCMYSLARKDKEMYPDIITAGTDAPYLTNSTLPPVEETDFVGVIRNQKKLQKLYTGGTTLNIYLGEKLVSYIQAKIMVEKIIKHTPIPYFSLNPLYSVCKDCGYISGEKYKCPRCSKKTEVFSRVVGYLKPIQNWNTGKKEEFKQRNNFKVDDINKLVKS